MQSHAKAGDGVRWLAVETSGRIGGVAVGVGPAVLEARTFRTALRHAAELLPAVEGLCRDHGLRPDAVDEVYVSGGPGSFTGLRIGVTFARTLALACGAKIVRVPTLTVIAQNALEASEAPATVAVVLDAKRRRIFAAVFVLEDGAYLPTQEPAELDPDVFFATVPGGCAALGEGLAYHGEAVERAGLRLLPDALNRPRAEVVHRIGYREAREGRYDDPRGLVPIYIRRPEAEEVWERRHPGI